MVPLPGRKRSRAGTLPQGIRRSPVGVGGCGGMGAAGALVYSVAVLNGG